MRIDSSSSFMTSQLIQSPSTGTDQYGMHRKGNSKKPDEPQECNLASCTQRALTPDEQLRLEELKNQLVDLLRDTDNITPEKEQRVRQIEKEIEKLTGVKIPKRNLSSMTKMLGDMNGKNKKKDEASLADLENKAQREEQIRAFLLPTSQTKPGKGIMDFALQAYAKTAASNLLGSSFNSKS